MIRNITKQLLSAMLSLVLVMGTTSFAAQTQQPGATGYSGQGVPLTAEELQQLVAPIALYPDALVAQILGAATFPDQIAAAASWLQQNSKLTGASLMKSVDAQPWDPSVKALTQFPSVLANLATNLSWTSSLGEAYHTQAADVMSAVQFLRAKALAAGNLKSSSQLTVVQQSPQVIVIQPANPQVVYVPVYNPTVVYGYPYVTPAYVAPPVAATAVVAFGVGIAVGAMMSSTCCVWGYSSWNCGWHGTTTVVYHGGAYYGNSAWHGGYYGSSASAYGAYGAAHASNGYNPSTGTYARGGTVSNGYGSQSAGQAYNPRTGAYGCHRARFQRQWELGKLDGFEERQHRVQPTSDDRSMEPRARCKPRTVARLPARRGSTTAPPWVRPQMATSTRPQTATLTATPGAVGKEIRTILRNPARRVTPDRAQAVQGLGRAGRRAVHRPSAAAAAEVGHPGQRALVVRQAEAAAVAGVAGEHGDSLAQTKSTLGALSVRFLKVNDWENRYVARNPQNPYYDPVSCFWP